MWFLYVAVALVLVIAGGIYARRRIAAALSQLGVSAGRVRVVRWVIGWLLFGYPILLFLTIAISLLLGRATVPRFDGLLASWLLGVPFVAAVLLVVQSVPWLIAIDLAALVMRRRRDAAAVARLRAIAVLAAVAVFAVYTPARVIVQRDELRVRHHELGAPGTASEPFRIAFLGDVQQDANTGAGRAREVYALINASKPDIVLSGGDWINSGPDYIEAAAAAAGTLHSRLGTFSVRGDHEHFAYADRERSAAEVERAMRAHGVDMASNEVRWFEHRGKRIAVVLLSYNYIHRTDRPTIEALLASVAGADYSIVVTHQFDARLAAVLGGKVDLVLAGHTHGGQVNPVIGVTHVNLARLETEFVDGRYQLGTTAVIVTAGIGYSLVPIRYAAPGSIELIDLRLCGPRRE
ncbi:MAG TPA: metallophosphoesterase [Kofleriaceae bacterium]